MAWTWARWPARTRSPSRTARSATTAARGSTPWMGGNSTLWLTNDTASYNGGSGMNLGGMGGGSTLWAAGNAANHDGGNGITVGGIKQPGAGHRRRDGEYDGMKWWRRTAVTGMVAGSIVELTDNAIEHDAGPPLETDLSVDLTDSDLSATRCWRTGRAASSRWTEAARAGTWVPVAGRDGVLGVPAAQHAAGQRRNTLTVQPGVH